MISFIQVIDVLRTFAQGHFQIQKFDFEFREQMPNLATVNEAYPMLYVVPVGTSNIQFGKEFELDIYCVDRYKKDRSNVGYVISDTELILSDLSVYLENQTAFDSSYGNTTPINNDLLDYVGGHVMRIRVTVEKQALCEIPFDGDQPTPPTCPSALVRNSDGTWSEIVPSGATYVLPDTPVTVLDSNGGILFTTDVVSITGGNVTAPDATYLVEYENGTPIESGSILSGGSVTVQVPDPIVCEDATAELYFDGELIDTLTIPSGDTDSFNIDCNTLLNAVRVESIGGVGHQHGGTFVLNGEVNGKDSYVKSDDPDRIIYYDGTRWVLEKLGGGAHTHEAAIGNEDYPWEADWTLEDLIVTQATIGTYCANGASCEDATWTLLDTDGNVLDSGTIASGDSANIIAPDGTVVNSDSSYTNTVASGGTLVLPDTTINITDQLGNPLDTITFPVYTPVNIDIDSYCPPAVTRSTATLMKTGQTTSYRTGDDGDLEVGRATNFLTLDAAPVHNDGSATINTTTNRFTDTLGGSTYSDDIVLDWSTWDGSTLLGFTRNFVTIGVNWNSSIDACLAYSVGSFVSGWRMPNIIELLVLKSIDLGLNYAPFINFTGSILLQTSTNDSTNCLVVSNIAGLNFSSTSSKTLVTSRRAIACRTFSLSTSNILS